MGKKILVILGHPSANSFCGALSGQYAEAAREAGHEVRELQLGTLDFDPSLREGYGAVQQLESDLLAAQAAIRWADHLTFVYPIWWGSVPAVLKGFLDRTFLPGFAFKYQPGAYFPDQLLKGRTAHLLVTMDSPPWYFRWVNRMPGIHQMKKTTLSLCGVKTLKVAAFGPLNSAKPDQRAGWLKRARAVAVGV